jgi:hypothetical protein
VIVADTDYNSDRMEVCVRRMIERQVDGVAIMTSEKLLPTFSMSFPIADCRSSFWIWERRSP